MYSQPNHLGSTVEVARQTKSVGMQFSKEKDWFLSGENSHKVQQLGYDCRRHQAITKPYTNLSYCSSGQHPLLRLHRSLEQAVLEVSASSLTLHHRKYAAACHIRLLHPQKQLRAMHLLDLPLEVLEAIIEYVILDTRAAPHFVDERRAVSSRQSVYSHFMCGVQVKAQPTMCAPNSTALYSCCRALGRLTRVVVNRLDASNRCVFQLDVLLVGERELWTTWLCLPTATRRIKQLNITIRIAGGHLELHGSSMPNDRIASAVRNGFGTEPLVWAFFYVLNAVLSRIPTLDLQDKRQSLNASQRILRDRNTQVDHLWLDVKACDGVLLAEQRQYQDWLAVRPESSTSTSPFGSTITTELQSLAMRPKWLADILTAAFASAFFVREDIAPVFERLGDAAILVDGAVYTHLNLGRQFAAMRQTSTGPDAGWVTLLGAHASPQEAARFREWWRMTLRRRVELGFPVGGAEQHSVSTSTESLLFPLPPRNTTGAYTSRRNPWRFVARVFSALRS